VDKTKTATMVSCRTNSYAVTPFWGVKIPIGQPSASEVHVSAVSAAGLFVKRTRPCMPVALVDERKTVTSD